MDMEKFLSRHNIGNETFENLVEESSDYGAAFKGRISRLEDENEKLKKEYFGLQFDFDEKLKEHRERYVKHMNDTIRLEKENEELKKENEKLKEQLDTANEDEEKGHHWVRMSDGEEVKVIH